MGAGAAKQEEIKIAIYQKQRTKVLKNQIKSELNEKLKIEQERQVTKKLG